jgi:hypothetical protein
MKLDARLQPLAAELVKTWQAQAKNAAAVTAIGVSRDLSFTYINPESVVVAQREAAELISNISKEQKAAYRTMLVNATRAGTSVDDIARDLRRSIGLTKRQTVTLSRYTASLDDLAPRARATLTDRMRARMIRSRAETIARTEAARFSNSAQQDVWQRGQEAGVISDNAMRVWITTPDELLCPICEPMEGQEAATDAKFSSTYSGEAFDAPPAHPRCRCTTGLNTNSKTPRHVTTTEAMYKGDGSWDGLYTDASGRRVARSTLHARIVRDMTTGIRKARGVKTLYSTGGGPATGKSTVLESGLVKYPSQKAAVWVDPDRIKAYLPEYNAAVAAKNRLGAAIVHEESSHISKLVMKEAVRRGQNIVQDTVGDGGVEKLLKTLNAKRDEGYRIVANYTSNRMKLALQLSEKRGLKTGRFVPPTFIREAHIMVSRALPTVMQEGAFDAINLWNTDIKGTARLIATADASGTLVIKNQKLWEQFLAKGNIKP